MSAGGVRAVLWSVLLSLLVILLITVCYAQQVPCRYVPNGANITIACANGYYVTTTPEGEVVDGVGMADPNGTAQGSGIVINPATGGPTGFVTAPTQNVPVPAPGQGYYYGLPVPQ